MKFISCVAVCICLLLVEVAVAQNCDQFYTTKSGDTLSSIAGQFYADKQKWRIIKEANTAGRTIKENSIPINLRLFIPCLNGGDEVTARDTKNRAAGNVGNGSLLESLLGDGIIKKPPPADLDSTAEIETNDVTTEKSPAKRITIKKTPTISTESNALLEDLLGEDIISKKTLEEEEIPEDEQTLEDIELTNALREILLKPPSKESTDSVYDKEIVNDVPVITDSDDSSTVNEDLNAEKDIETVADRELAADAKQEQGAQKSEAETNADEQAISAQSDDSNNTELETAEAEAGANDDEQAISAQSDEPSNTELETADAEADANADEQVISAQSDEPSNAELETADAEADANDDEQAISAQSDEPSNTELETADAEADANDDEQAISAQSDEPSNTELQTADAEADANADEQVISAQSDEPSNTELEIAEAEDVANNDAQATSSLSDDDSNSKLESTGVDDEVEIVSLTDSNNVENDESEQTQTTDQTDIDNSNQAAAEIIELAKINTEAEEIVSGSMDSNDIESDQQNNQQPVVTAIEIEQLKNDLSQIQLQAKLEIEAMKSRMEELEQELVEAQRNDANASLNNQVEQFAATQTEQDLGLNDGQQASDVIVEQVEQEQEQQSDVQIASIEMPDVDDLGDSASGNKLSPNESLMSVLRLRLIETITSLKSELSATDDSDTQKADLIRAEIEKLESTFEEIESIAAEELEREKSKVEKLEARLNSVKKANSSASLANRESENKKNILDSCKKFPNLCKYLERK